MAAYVQSRASGGNAITSLALAFSSNLTAGNLVVVGAGSDGNFATFSDTLGTRFRSTQRLNGGGNGTNAEIRYHENTPGGANTVTISWASSTVGSIAIAEYSGIGLANALDQCAVGSGSAVTAASTPALTTRVANSLLIVVTCRSAAAPNTTTPGTNYTEREDNATGNRPIHLQDRIVSATGSYAGAATLDAAANYSQVMAVFADADFGGGAKYDDRYRFRPSVLWSGTSTLGTKRSTWPDDACDFGRRDSITDNGTRQV